MNSPTLKSFGDERIAAGELILVVDLENCGGMDSTFMGTLAGLAARLSTRDGGLLQIANVSNRNQSSLQDLGLDFLMEIDPPEALWRGSIDSIRSQLNLRNTSSPSQTQRANHVLQAHQTLAEANDENAEKFCNVVKILEKDLAEKQKLADGRKSS